MRSEPAGRSGSEATEEFADKPPITGGEVAASSVGGCLRRLSPPSSMGLRGELVRVEIDVAPGLPACHIVGLPDAALSEARERVRGAIRNSGFEYPASRITVNLAPADRRKRGAAYDLAIAVGILVASGQIRRGTGTWALLGELSLAGTVESIPGVLPMVATLERQGYRRVIVPAANEAEARLVSGVEAMGVDGLDDAARLVAGPRGRTARRAERRIPVELSGPKPSAVRHEGQLRWRRLSIRSISRTFVGSITLAGRWKWPWRAATTCCWLGHRVRARPCWRGQFPACCRR